MLEVKCKGTPYEIGRQHGRKAQEQVRGSIEFYKDFFLQTAKLSWIEACKVALDFKPMLASSWPGYIQEMEGIAHGAEVDFESILALNVRTEIAYGMAADGCTAFAWTTKDASFIAQNWDWKYEQRANIIKLHIEQSSKPTIQMMAEAGLLGKIGLNSSGVGVTLNAVSAKGVDVQRLPVHLALRTVLESRTMDEARQRLLGAGVAAACHITIADPRGAVGLECSAFDIVEIPANQEGICTHSNHFIRPHVGESAMFLTDSPVRLARVKELLKSIGPKPTLDVLTDTLKDKQNYPGAICRGQSEKSSLETLFSIVMDLENCFARVKMGQPTEGGEDFELRPY